MSANEAHVADRQPSTSAFSTPVPVASEALPVVRPAAGKSENKPAVRKAKRNETKVEDKVNRKISVQKKRFRLAYASRNTVQAGGHHPMETGIICKTPNRCQQKMRLLRKTLRRTAWNCVIAAGLESAACFHLKDLRNRSQPKLERTPSNEPSVEPSDWSSQMHCIFCENSPNVPPATKSTPISTLLEMPRKPVMELPSLNDNLDWLRSLQLQLPSLNLGINMDSGHISPFTVPSTPNSALTASVWAKVNPFRFMPEERSLSEMVEQKDEETPLIKPASKSEEIATIPPVPKRSRSRTPGGRQRRYSPAELRAAIDEVERGNVGTRKAALLYGIPRSTLRNKVGKILGKKPDDAPDTPLDMSPTPGVTPVSGLISVKEEAPNAVPNKQDITFALKRIISQHLSEKFKIPVSSSPKTAKSAEHKPKRLRGGIDASNRHKRGRYRKYKQGDLEEALRLVKQGEMTVHRAGHLFGIPHSTLEYKIKERNGTLSHINGTIHPEPEKSVKVKSKKVKAESNGNSDLLPSPSLPDFSLHNDLAAGSLLNLDPNANFLFPNNPFLINPTTSDNNIFNQLLALQILRNTMMGVPSIPPPTFPLFESSAVSSAPFRPWTEGQSNGGRLGAMQNGTEKKPKKATKRKNLEDLPLNLTMSKEKSTPKIVE